MKGCTQEKKEKSKDVGGAAADSENEEGKIIKRVKDTSKGEHNHPLKRRILLGGGREKEGGRPSSFRHLAARLLAKNIPGTCLEYIMISFWKGNHLFISGSFNIHTYFSHVIFHYILPAKYRRSNFRG